MLFIIDFSLVVVPAVKINTKQSQYLKGFANETLCPCGINMPDNYPIEGFVGYHITVGSVTMSDAAQGSPPLTSPNSPSSLLVVGPLLTPLLHH